MIKLTYEEIVALEPCSLAKIPNFGRRKYLNAKQAIEFGVLIPDLLWVAGRLSMKCECVQFALLCSQRVQHHNTDQRVKVALDATQNWLDITADRAASEFALSAVRSAARSARYAAESAAWSARCAAQAAESAAGSARCAAWSARCATEAARFAAESAAWSARSAAESVNWSARFAAESAARSAEETAQKEIFLKIFMS